jgi:hypothetical protein
LPQVAPIFEEYVATVDVGDRLKFLAGGFFDHRGSDCQGWMKEDWVYGDEGGAADRTGLMVIGIK